MMPNLAAIYDAAFYAEWGKGHELYVRTAEVITDALIAELRPKRIADIGSGCGVYAHFFAGKGVPVFALDGVQPPSEHSFTVSTHLQDLTVPFENSWGNFDFALCLEVAEHIPESLADVFLDNLIRFSDTIVLSAAPPHQGGHHHVNEQPKRYWVSRLAQRGYIYDRPRTGRIVNAVCAVRPPYMWMAQQLSVYKKSSGPVAPGVNFPFGLSKPGS